MLISQVKKLSNGVTRRFMSTQAIEDVERDKNTQSLLQREYEQLLEDQIVLAKIGRWRKAILSSPDVSDTRMPVQCEHGASNSHR